ncbi:MAG: L,D-transpeptidase family protein [Acidobacteriota bacterium]
MVQRKYLALVLAPILLGSARPHAVVVDGAIVRDADTQRDIEATASVALKRPEKPFRLVVSRSRYRLDVLDGERIVKTYPVAFGAPEGPKEKSGDHKTPEGAYVLIPHHPSPGFGECFYVCYPSEEDAARGLERGLISKGEHQAIIARCRAKERPPDGTRLGGLILLHGTKDRSMRGLTDINWTWGCIAMENPQVVELLSVYDRKDRPTLEIVP